MSSAKLQDNVERQLRIERAMNTVALQCIGTTDIEDDKISSALEALCDATDTKGILIYKLNKWHELMELTHYRRCAALSCQLEEVRQFPLTKYPYWMNRLKKGQAVIHGQPYEMPPENSEEREAYVENNWENMLIIPLRESEALIGAIWLEEPSILEYWTLADWHMASQLQEIFQRFLCGQGRHNELVKTLDVQQETIGHVRRMQSHMLQQEKLMGIGQLAAGVAHEINNPLGYLISNFSTLSVYVSGILPLLSKVRVLEKELKAKNSPLYTILEDAWDPDEMEFILEDMLELMNESEDGLSRISEIVQSLRGFTHTTAEDMLEMKNINQVIRDVLYILGDEFRAQVSVQTDLADLPKIQCQSDQLSQAIINIINNAIQAMEDRSEKQLTIRTYEDQDHVGIAISDTGTGIPKEVRSRMFEPFFTTKAIGQGTGLGLSVAYDTIVNKHGGELHCDSEVEQGTTMHVLIPKTQAVGQHSNEKSR